MSSVYMLLISGPCYGPEYFFLRSQELRIQGGESLDLLRLFYTCILTEWERKLFTSFLVLRNFHMVKCRKLVFIRYLSVLCFMLHAEEEVFSYATSSKLRISFFARDCA